jgi:hypothetical protein
MGVTAMCSRHQMLGHTGGHSLRCLVWTSSIVRTPKTDCKILFYTSTRGIILLSKRHSSVSLSLAFYTVVAWVFMCCFLYVGPLLWLCFATRVERTTCKQGAKHSHSNGLMYGKQHVNTQAAAV